MARTDDNIPVDKNYRFGFCKNKFKKTCGTGSGVSREY
jgi:hypothetical protein